MASKRPSGLGKGLGALLGDDVMKSESSGSLSIPISQVESYSGQPRKHFDEESLQELADSITDVYKRQGSRLLRRLVFQISCLRSFLCFVDFYKGQRVQ